MSTAKDRGGEKWFITPSFGKDALLTLGCELFSCNGMQQKKKKDLKAPTRLPLGFGVIYGYQGLDTDYRPGYKSHKYYDKLLGGTARVLLRERQWTKLVLRVKSKLEYSSAWLK